MWRAVCRSVGEPDAGSRAAKAMNPRFLLAGAIACLGLCALPDQRAAAQGAAQFSYITDRAFTSPDQLMGYDFLPARREVPGEEPEEIPVGKYSFGITLNNLYVEGPGIRGVYSINQTNQTDYGFLLNTMNARDPTIQGHLKIVTDELGYVEGLIFKRSNDDREVIFFLRVIPEEVEQFEAEYFTNAGEEQITNIDSLWTGIEVRPFFRVYEESGVQQRITPGDSVYLNFYKVVTVEERERGAMAALGIGKKQKVRRGSGATVNEAIAALPSEPLAMEGGAMDAAEARAMMLATLQAGERPDEPTMPTVTEAPPAVDSTVAVASADTTARVTASWRPASVDSALADELALAAMTNSAALAALGIDLLLSAPDSNAIAAAAQRATLDSLAATTKYKVTTEYFVDINAYTTYDDGTSLMANKTFEVFAVTEREDGTSRKGGNRFQWELELDRKRTGYVYLDEFHRVNSIELDGQTFYVRGKGKE